MKYKNLEEFKVELKKMTANICDTDDSEVIDYYYKALLESHNDYHQLQLKSAFSGFENMEMESIDPEFTKIVNENFWDMVSTGKIGFIDWDESDTGWERSAVYDSNNNIIDESKYELVEVLERDKYEHITKAKYDLKN